MKCADPLYYEQAAAILRHLQMGTLATATAGGAPWNTPLVIERNQKLRLYWFSDKNSQHARNVRHNPRVFLVFYDSTLADGHGRREGLFVQATARELHDLREIRRACKMRKADPDYYKSFTGAAVRRVYEAIPRRIWINDVQMERGVFIRDYRVELSRAKLRAALK